MVEETNISEINEAEFEEKVNAELVKQGIVANLFVGGSVGKGTCLPGIRDIDYFMRFDLKKYGEEDISEIIDPKPP